MVCPTDSIIIESLLRHFSQLQHTVSLTGAGHPIGCQFRTGLSFRVEGRTNLTSFSLGPSLDSSAVCLTLSAAGHPRSKSSPTVHDLAAAVGCPNSRLRRLPCRAFGPAAFVMTGCTCCATSGAAAVLDTVTFVLCHVPIRYAGLCGAAGAAADTASTCQYTNSVNGIGRSCFGSRQCVGSPPTHHIVLTQQFGTHPVSASRQLPLVLHQICIQCPCGAAAALNTVNGIGRPCSRSLRI